MDKGNLQTQVFDPQKVKDEKTTAEKIYTHVGAILIGITQSIQVNSYVTSRSDELSMNVVVMIVFGVLIGFVGLRIANLVYEAGKKKDDYNKSRVSQISDNVVVVILSGLFSLVALLLLNGVYYYIFNTA